MPSTKEKYKDGNIESARRWLVKAMDTLAEARVLIESGQTRAGCYNRLYYSTHHIAKALLCLLGKRVSKHSVVISSFKKEWVDKRKFPKTYAKLIKDLEYERKLADYGEYVPTYKREVEKRLRAVENFMKKSSDVIPPIDIGKILSLLVARNPEITDFSFDVYCPKSYYHHTRVTLWAPKGITNSNWINLALKNSMAMLKNLKIKDYRDYVIGLDSKVNQYAEKHVVMLDFDDTSSIPINELKDEPGFVFRTKSGYHFLGSRLYDKSEWRKRMRKYQKIASKDHIQLSFKRGYGTLRLTESPRKSGKPAYVGFHKG